MKENNKQELSYFRLKLRSYMSEHHPERLQDTEFITARADMALTPTAMLWRKVSRTPKRKVWQVRSCIRACISQSMTRLYPSWRTSLKGNCQHRSLRNSPPYCCRTRLSKPHLTSSVWRTHWLLTSNTTVFTPNSQARLCCSPRATICQ